MVDNAFAVDDVVVDVEERIRREVAETFMAADEVHEQCFDNPVDDNGDSLGIPEDESTAEDTGGEPEDDSNFDPSHMAEAIQELFLGSKCTKLSTTILLMNLCSVHGVSNNFAEELFTLLHGHLLPDNNYLPKNFHAAHSLMQRLGLSYNLIHACEKGCVLFRGEHAQATLCPHCDAPRFKDSVRKRFPIKVLRHFPIIPRLQRMFRSPSISKLMLWHSENRSDRDGGDGLVQHPCDSKAWRHFHDKVDPTFGKDPRNTHFALAADGVNPFKQNRSTWFTWPVLLLNYNLPPWLSTKKFFVLLSLLIRGKESVTCEVFDVYLEPLVEELLELWGGVHLYRDMTSPKTWVAEVSNCVACCFGQFMTSRDTALLAELHIKVLLLVHVVGASWGQSIWLSLGNTLSQDQGVGCQMGTPTKLMV